MFPERGELELKAAFYLIKNVGPCLMLKLRLVEGYRLYMCNSISRMIFNSNYLEISFFQLQNISSPTIFQKSHSYLPGKLEENGLITFLI
jgi:hypothetical protein